MNNQLEVNFALAVREMSKAVFLMGFGILWIFSSLFILVLDKQTFMVLLNETWPIMVLVVPMIFSGYTIAKRLFKLYPINPESTRKTRHSRFILEYRKAKGIPVKL